MLKQVQCAETPILQTLQGHITLQLPHDTKGLQAPCFNIVQPRWPSHSSHAWAKRQDEHDAHASSYRKQSKDYSTRSTLTEAQSMIFIYSLSMSSLDVLLHLRSHYNSSLDINRTGFCFSQVIWVDRKGDSKQQQRNPKWKGRNNNHLLQWLQSVMSWLATVHHYCFLVSRIRSRAMCQGLHTVSC